MGSKDRGLFKSPEFKAALRELTAAALKGDRGAPYDRDSLIAGVRQLSDLPGEAHTAVEINRLAAQGKSLKDAMNTLTKDASLTPELKLVADALSEIVGDVPLRSVKDLRAADSRNFTNNRYVHILCNARHITHWLVLHKGVGVVKFWR